MAQSPYVKSLMRETGKDEQEVTRAWKKAQQLTAENYGMDVEDFERKQYEYAVETAKRILGVNEASYLRDFYDSDKNAREYLEEVVMTSGDVGVNLDNVSMRGQKGTYTGDGNAMDLEMDDETAERQSHEYDDIGEFDHPNDNPPTYGNPVGNDGPEYGEDEEY